MSVIVPSLANYQGPRRLPPLYVEPGNGPYYAALTAAADGVAVRLSRSDRPRGQRLIWSDVIPASMHRVAARIHDEVARMNRSI